MDSDRRHKTKHQNRQRQRRPAPPDKPSHSRQLKGRTVVRLATDRPKVPLRDRTRYALRVGERARYGIVVDPVSGRLKMGRLSVRHRG